ncbi:hypothetical protein [Desulfatitalea alkaliphila]|uniref:Uncharacterized protein n=1 Tax=Desulfatitalea alkaliphila TaxID=2929485 RepID=A0AA41QZ50_9BACT|nr:hypothetical protein [Desulfatitalea alkaliphila]MCJ8499742.1 hypothetical protein [Desulfatitalea alkaliphila]
MTADRTGYNASITESWKQQLLLNIVKIRYVEPLFFVDVGDIVAAYSLETGANVGFSGSMFGLSGTGDTSRLELGISGKYTDRPTITYRPLTGTAFRKGVVSPIPVRNILLGLNSGISAEFLFEMSVRGINGLRNEAHLPGAHLPVQSAFQRVVQIISRLQMLDAVRVTSRSLQSDEPPILVLALGGWHSSYETNALVRELQDLLGLDPALNEYVLTAGHPVRKDNVIALQTFSLMQMLAAVAARIQIPEPDLVKGRAIPGASQHPETAGMGAVAVKSSSTRPDQAFVSVRYRDHWFWVDDSDLGTKRVFSFIMLAFTMLEDVRAPSVLQLTIPAQ